MKTISCAIWLVTATASAQGLPVGSDVPFVRFEQSYVAPPAAPITSDRAAIGRLARLSPPMTQPRDSAGPRVRVTANNKHITGQLVRADADTVTILTDADHDTIVQLPLWSISRAAVSKSRRPRALAVFAGAGVGVSAGGYSFLLGLGICGDAFLLDSCSDSAIRASRTIGVAIGSAAGVAVMRYLRRERWRPVPVSSLVTRSGFAKP